MSLCVCICFFGGNSQPGKNSVVYFVTCHFSFKDFALHKETRNTIKVGIFRRTHITIMYLCVIVYCSFPYAHYKLGTTMEPNLRLSYQLNQSLCSLSHWADGIRIWMPQLLFGLLITFRCTDTHHSTMPPAHRKRSLDVVRHHLYWKRRIFLYSEWMITSTNNHFTVHMSMLLLF